MFTDKEFLLISELLRIEYDGLSKDIGIAIVYGHHEKKQKFYERRKIALSIIEKLEKISDRY